MPSLLLHCSVLIGTLLALTTQADATQQSTLQGQATEWPSLHLHFTLKRSTIQIYGQSEFSMVANPIVSSDSTSVLYNSFAAFTEGMTSYNYSLVDGIAYVSSVTAGDNVATPLVKCLDSDALPPINSIANALNDATAISTNGLIECRSGEMFKVSVSNMEFVVCYSGSVGFTMHGSDMDITVEYTKNRTDILAPVDIDTTQECVAVVSPSSMTSVGKALLTGEPIVSDDGIKSLAYEGGSYSNVKLNEAYKVAQKAYRKNVYAALCSNGFSGLPSSAHWAYWILGLTIPHKSFKNDGMVEFFSCAGGFPESKFGSSHNNRFYVTKLNHDDTTFRNGDALLNEAKMPIKWFECLL
ncbi:hypothetical protein JM18_007011 [Phytophthora kernoviae]|uniref:Uncharacterized protein n=2 Tax=Phytophthora kernoviae TaxID=325452 RepID=A0A921V631_9STRA|nr:hypothetical protein G195_010938 [Phytophthora kernoviae 00238/432]KAG2520505.1 hypothetical protein JM18_007011 [Phytophthora kernoviae]